MKANYHTHTYRCHHASGTEREYIEEAIRHGLRVLGFSDHSPYIFRDGHYSSFRMFPEELEGYVKTLSDLRDEYADRIEIHIGLEAEYYPGNWEDYISFLRGKGVEYLILGQHFAGRETPDVLYSAGASDSVQRLKDYVDTVVAGAQTGLFSYVAHPDMINFTGDHDLYISELNRLADGIQNAGLPFEINLLGLREGRNYPTEVFFKILEERNAPVILGSDAHEAKYVYHEKTIDRAMEIARKYHLNVTEEIDITRLKRNGI